MIFYVAHKFENNWNNVTKARQKVLEMQRNDRQNCYVCPALTFSYIDEEITQNEQSALRLDLLSVCDVLIVASEENAEVKMDLEFANLVGMEVRYAQY